MPTVQKGEKSNKFFPNLEKKAWNPISNTKTYRKKYLMKNKLGRVELFYKNLFKKNIEKCSVEHTAFLDTLPLPILNENEKQLYERALTETELNVAIMSMAPKTHLETMN